MRIVELKHSLLPKTAHYNASHTCICALHYIITESIRRQRVVQMLSHYISNMLSTAKLPWKFKRFHLWLQVEVHPLSYKSKHLLCVGGGGGGIRVILSCWLIWSLNGWLKNWRLLWTIKWLLSFAVIQEALFLLFVLVPVISASYRF